MVLRSLATGIARLGTSVLIQRAGEALEQAGKSWT